MKIIQIIQSMDQKSGGTTEYMRLIARELALSIYVHLITNNSTNPVSLDPNITTYFLNKSWPFFQGYSKEFAPTLKKLNGDLIHINGLWGFPMNYAAKHAKKNHIPYVLSPHGMLEPNALKRKSIKKELARFFYQNTTIKNAACLHATGIIEKDNIYKMGYKKPIAVIPNGIDLADFYINKHKTNNKNKKLLFLSRLHPHKGLEVLIKAWENVHKKHHINWNLDIAGIGSEDYINKLNKLINECGISQHTKIIGPLFDQDKLNTYQNADLFILPSFSENFGIVVAEALACGVPVITTNGTPWQALNTTRAGWCIDLSIEELTSTLEKALSISDEERISMGLNGRRLVEDNYSIESVALKMKQLYEWLLYKTKKPDFVYLD